MRFVIWFLLLAALAVAITLLARFDAGYVVIVLPPWRIEMSFILSAFITAGVFGIGYFGVRMLRLTLRLPADVRAWRRRRRSDKAEDEMSRAIAAFLAGQPDHARNLASSALKREHSPLAALVAAYAALEAGDHPGAAALLKGLKTEVPELAAARQAVEKRLGETAGPG